MAITYYESVGGEIFGERIDGDKQDYLPDAIGSVVCVVSAAGQIVSESRYRPFGDVLSQSGLQIRFGWIGALGYMNGLAGSSYVRNRHYRSSQGLWRSVDLLWPRNKAYVYASNDPVTKSDPLGLEALIWKLGGTDPVIHFDAGSGAKEWNPKLNIQGQQFTAGIMGILSLIVSPRWYDASKHMNHFLFGGGTSLKARVHRLIKYTELANIAYRNAVWSAVQVSTKLKVGTHIYTSNVMSGNVSKEDNPNWHYATGGYAYWFRFKVTIGCSKTYLVFQYHYVDRYNWDAQKGIGDAVMADLHRQGYGDDFTLYGHTQVDYSWSTGREKAFLEYIYQNPDDILPKATQ